MSSWSEDYQATCEMVRSAWQTLYALNPEHELVQYYDPKKDNIRTVPLIERAWNQEEYRNADHRTTRLLARYHMLLKEEGHKIGPAAAR